MTGTYSKALLVALCVALFAPSSVHAQIEKKKIYGIRRDGDRIGEYRFSVIKNGNHLTVSAEMSLRVKVLFFTVYSAEHEREEEWENGRLVKSRASSEYNGKDYSVDLWVDEGQYLLMRNAKISKLSPPVITLVPWLPEPAGRKATLVTEKGNHYPVELKPLGEEQIEIDGRSVNSRHYRLSGKKTWELWYDKEGSLLKVSYEKSGATLDIELENRQ